eukprot:1185658-Prorocentrum_minimum.AAC.4
MASINRPPTPEADDHEPTLQETINAKLVQSGEKERLRQLLRERLVECGWRDELKAKCRVIIKQRGLSNVTGARDSSLDCFHPPCISGQEPCHAQPCAHHTHAYVVTYFSGWGRYGSRRAFQRNHSHRAFQRSRLSEDRAPARDSQLFDAVKLDLCGLE